MSEADSDPKTAGTYCGFPPSWGQILAPIVGLQSASKSRPDYDLEDWDVQRACRLARYAVVSLMCDVGYDGSNQFETANGFTQRAHEDLINTCGFGIWAYLPGRIVTPRRREPTDCCKIKD